MPTWTPILAVADLKPDSSRAVVTELARLAVFCDESGEINVTDLACPHQGYPLTQGAIDGTTVTCAFHNFRFDLRSGACLKGDEDLRRWPSRIVNGQVEVDLTPPDPTVAIHKAMANLDQALADVRLGQVLRELVRLQTLDVSPKRLLAHIAADDGARAEWGTSHVAPVAAECLESVGDNLEESTRWMALAVELGARGHARRPRHDQPDPHPNATLDRFLEAVEGRDVASAQAHLLGAPAAETERWLLLAACEHVVDYGHGLIYALAIADLLPHATDVGRAALLCGIVRRLAEGTREDTLPAWRPYQKALAKLDSDHWPAARNGYPTDTTALLAQVIAGRGAERSMVQHLADGAALDSLLQALIVGASERMLRFNPDHDATSTLENNWLDATHLLTFVDAVARTRDRLDDPIVGRLLLQGAWFISINAGLDGERDQPTAPDDAQQQLERSVLEDRVPVPIVAAHVLKTARAATRLAKRLPAPQRRLPMDATWRFVQANPRQRWINKRIHEAIELVCHGRTPRSLNG